MKNIEKVVESSEVAQLNHAKLIAKILRSVGVTLSVLAILILMVVASTVDYESVIQRYLHDSSTYAVIGAFGILCAYCSYKAFSTAEKIECKSGVHTSKIVVGVPVDEDPLLTRIREGERQYNEFKAYKKAEEDMLKTGAETLAKANNIYKEA